MHARLTWLLCLSTTVANKKGFVLLEKKGAVGSAAVICSTHSDKDACSTLTGNHNGKSQWKLEVFFEEED